MEDKRKELDVILREITAGLNGDAEHDGPYLMEQMEKYKSHDLAKEIVRACGRLMYNVIPEESKDKIVQIFGNEHLGVDATLDEARFNIYKGDFRKAQTIMADLIRKIEELDAYQDDIASEYHTFSEPFEEVLYRFHNEPEKDVRHADIRYSEIYLLYGTILVELKDFENAKAALRTALKWNPVGAPIHFEYAEIFKMTEDYEEFFRLTVEAFKYAFRSTDIARCYRNLGFYFIEKELYKEAAGCYFMSTFFEPDSKQAMSELYYISTKTNKETVNPSTKDLKKIANKYGFPLGPDDDVVGLSYVNGKHFYEQEEYRLAGYFWSITYDLIKDEEIKKKLDEIERKMN